MAKLLILSFYEESKSYLKTMNPNPPVFHFLSDFMFFLVSNSALGCERFLILTDAKQERADAQ
jgi:hypothetical protein